ncbi:hypothetical protein G5B30_09645 [Sphingobacterium sp. SGG-5]|uniref:substrate import-associated zinc metallohydrolase lipoprotein n=1 Tax=Sphingobacterium sp. SGG-5 TaxID=2710881 RepID=UPI0013EE15CE|nr:substrate import-associated zinc metallohydrolase lipoprotein [Sphingobacterium sp. SGG-5]NGM62177.1 hypothetical protein [Sphingobacterium sp. SGG-5]
MKALKYIFLFWVVFATSCKTELPLDKQIGEYDRDGWPRTEVDDWLQETFTDPYNIEVKYRWDASEFAQNRTFVPVDMDKIQPFMNFVKSAVIDVTAQVNGPDFVKKHFPKQLMLAGSYFYNVDGTIYAGIAENARKVFLFGVNDFGGESAAEVKSKVRVIYHELTHILHQKVMYPVEFKTITPGAYTSNWNAVTLQNARNAGFVNAYSMSTTNEDFAEITANILVNGRAGFESIIASANAEGQALLRQKTAILVDYFAQVWNVDIWAWADALAEKLDELVEEPVVEPDFDAPLYPQLGDDKVYKSVIVDMEHSSIPANLKNLWAQAASNLLIMSDGRSFHNKFSMHFTSNNTVQLIFYYYEANGIWSVPQRLNYQIIPQSDGGYRFAYFSSPTPASSLRILPALDPFLKEWLDANSFLVQWADETIAPPLGDEKYIHIAQADDPQSFIVGELGNVDLTSSVWPFSTTDPQEQLHDQLGTGSDKLYSTLLFSEHTAQSQGFKDDWEAVKAAVRESHASYPTNHRTLFGMALYIGATLNDAKLAVFYGHASNITSPNSVARYNLNLSIDANGIAKVTNLTNDTFNGNAANLRTTLQPFFDKYIINSGGMRIIYAPETVAVPPTGQKYGMIIPVNSPNNYFFGLVNNFPILTATTAANMPTVFN